MNGRRPVAWLAVGTILALGIDLSAAEITANPATLAETLAKCKGGETILLAAGDYPALAINKKFAADVTIKSAEALKARMVGGISFSAASHVVVEGMTLTWPQGGKAGDRFVDIKQSDHIQVRNCEIFDDPAKDTWQGMSVMVSESSDVLVKGGRFHHVNFGVCLYKSKQVTVDGVDIGPWSHEDGVRLQNCDGALIQNNHIHNDNRVGKPTTGHVDCIQFVYWSHNVTIKNNVLNCAMQGIGAFGSAKTGEPKVPLKNCRFEGNLIYDIYTPHFMTVCDAESPVFINNTLPQGRLVPGQGTTNAIVKNNIMFNGGRSIKADYVKELDYNLWIGKPDGMPPGPNCKVVEDAGFVNAPVFFTTTYWGKTKECTRSKFMASGQGFAVGDLVEILNPNGMARDGVLRKVTKVAADYIEVDPPIDQAPAEPVILINKWAPGTTSAKLDYRLKPSSPAVDSGADVQRQGVIGKPDRGAFEYDPAAK